MTLRFSHTILFVELIMEFEHVSVEEDKQVLNIALRLRQFGDDCFAKANMPSHMIYDLVQVAQLEAQGEG